MRRAPLPLAAPLLATLLLLAAASAAGAAEPPGDAAPEAVLPASPAPRSPADAAAALEGLIAEERNRSALAGPPQRLPPEWEDEKTRAAYRRAARAYFDYRAEGLRHRGGVFAWQLVSSKIIFVVVVLLVLSGVYFSGVQFHATLSAWKVAAARQKKGDAASPAGPAPLGGELEAGLDRLKVSSPVLGVVILALSFLFFYLYIVHVHPIQEIL